MTEIFLRLLSLSFSGTLIALLIFAVGALLGRRLSRTWRYYIWLVVLMRMVLPFALPGHNMMDSLVKQSFQSPSFLQQSDSMPVAMESESLPSSASEVLEVSLSADGLQGAGQDALDGTVPDQVTEVTPGPGFRQILHELWQYAWVAWLGIAVLLFVRILTSYHSFTRFIRAGWKPVDQPDVLDTLDEACRAYGLKRTLPLYLNPLASSPMLVGVLRPVIVLPSLAMEKERLWYVLAHELIHYKRQDILYKWLTQVVSCLHWFNPVLYFIRRDIHIACELSCDERVLSRLPDAAHRAYGDTLLAVIQTSGQYGDLVASVTMSEEGKMMKKRLHSIVHPHKKSWLSAAASIALSLCLLGGAAYAGAYTGAFAEGAPDAVPEPTSVLVAASQPTEGTAPTATPTPGERLDRFLGDVDELADSFGEHAKEWGETVAEKANAWAEEWDWGTKWDWANTWGWVDNLRDDDGMFSSFHSDDLWVVNEGYFGDGYILHLKYNSAGHPKEDTRSVLSDPSVLLPASLQAYAEDEAFLQTLQDAVQHFQRRHPQPNLREGTLQLVSVGGPYDESPDVLLENFYAKNDLGPFVAVLNSGLTSSAQREALLRDAAVIESKIPYFAMLLDEDMSKETADELLQDAYDSENIAVYSILLEYASPEAKQRLADRATSDGKLSFLASTGETPSQEAIDAMLEGDLGTMDVGMVALVSDFLTKEQALRIAEAAYEQDEVGIFSMVVDYLDDTAVNAFHERAHRDNKMSFYSLTDR